MKSVGAFEAKTHLNELLQRAAKGETIQITVRGVLVAKLVPSSQYPGTDPELLASEIRALRKGTSLGKATIRELIDEGRRY